MAAEALLSALTCVGTVLLILLSFTAIKQVTAVRTEVGYRRWCPLPLDLPFFLTFCSSSFFHLCLAHLFVLDMTKTWLHHKTANMSSIFFPGWRWTFRENPEVKIKWVVWDDRGSLDREVNTFRWQQEWFETSFSLLSSHFCWHKTPSCVFIVLSGTMIGIHRREFCKNIIYCKTHQKKFCFQLWPVFMTWLRKSIQ